MNTESLIWATIAVILIALAVVVGIAAGQAIAWTSHTVADIALAFGGGA